MSDNGYNGWKNWETWQINLWLDNEEPWYREKIRFLRRKGSDGLTETNIEAFCEETFGEPLTPDMSEGDWDNVCWSEILEHWIEEAKEYE